MQNNLFDFFFPKTASLFSPLFLIFSLDLLKIIKKAGEFTLDYNIECIIFQPCYFDELYNGIRLFFCAHCTIYPCSESCRPRSAHYPGGSGAFGYASQYVWPNQRIISLAVLYHISKRNTAAEGTFLLCGKQRCIPDRPEITRCLLPQTIIAHRSRWKSSDKYDKMEFHPVIYIFSHQIFTAFAPKRNFPNYQCMWLSWKIHSEFKTDQWILV